MGLRLVRASKGQAIACVALGVVFGIAQSYAANSRFLINLTFLGCSFVAFLFLLMLFMLLNTIGERRELHNRLLSWAFEKTASLKQMTARVAIILLVCWLPYLLLMYPGNLSNDTTGQLTMFYTLMGHGERWITAHHPVFDTLVFGAITYPFYAMGHFRLGVFLCIFLQELLTAASFGVAFVWAKKRLSVSNGSIAIVLGFAALCPIVPLMVCSLSKDTFFSWVYLIWLVFFLDCIICREVGRRRFVVLAISGALMVLTKKYGFFVAALSLIVLAVTFLVNKRRRTALVSFALVLVVGITYEVCVPLLDKATGATPAYKSDTLIVPLQQVAMAYSRYSDDFSSDELEVVSKFIDTNVIDSGNWDNTNTGTIKKMGDSSIPGGFTNNQIASFLSAWGHIGLRHPDAYVDGWLALEAPLFSFGKIVPLFDSLWHTWANASVIPDQYFDKSSPFAELSIQIEGWYYWLTTVPGVDLFLTQALYAVLVPTYFISSALKREKPLGVSSLTPVIVSFLGLMISPLVSPNFETMRYLVPFVYMSPTLLCVAWSQQNAPKQEGLAEADEVRYKKHDGLDRAEIDAVGRG